MTTHIDIFQEGKLLSFSDAGGGDMLSSDFKALARVCAVNDEQYNVTFPVYIYIHIYTQISIYTVCTYTSILHYCSSCYKIEIVLQFS